MNPMELNLQPGLMTGKAQTDRLEQLRQTYAQPSTQDQKKMKQAAQEFESIFVQQLLDAMDKTVDRQDSLLSGGSSEQYWRSMLNQEIAKSMCTGPAASGFGLAESIYRQMAQNLPAETPAASESGNSGEVTP